MVRLGGDEEECQYFTFVRNLQGDVLGILGKTLDNAGVLRVEYLYDPWGRPLRSLTTTYDESAAVLAELNPFRYRGYLYDEETGLYYLRTRYYNPAWGRFVNADSLLGKTGALLSHNIFAYCGNNPAMLVDPSGTAPARSGYDEWIYQRQITNLPNSYSSADEAAVAFARRYYGESLCARIEYGTSIYRREIPGRGSVYYYPTMVVGTPHSTNPRTPPLRSSDMLVAYTHTHPNSNEFSGLKTGEGDVEFAYYSQVPLYVNGSNLRVQKLDMVKRELSFIGTPIATERITAMKKYELSWRYYGLWYSSEHFNEEGKCLKDFPNCPIITWPTP